MRSLLDIKKISKTLILIICLLTASFYFYETILEIIPAIIVNDIMRSFHINAEQAGLLDVCYFTTYAIMQIPGGILLDRFGARKIMPIAAIFCFIGLSIFANTTYYSLAMLGRFIAGLGGTFGLMGAMFVVSAWVPRRFLAFALGTTITIGLSAGLLEGPLTFLVHAFDWRFAINALALIAFFIAVLMFVILKDPPEKQARQTKLDKHFFAALTIPRNWLIAIFGGLMYIPTGTLSVLWGVDYLMAYYPHISQNLAANINSMMFLGWIIGSPIAGITSDLFKTRKFFLMLSSVACCFLLITMTHVTTLTIPWMFTLILFVGIFSSFSGLTFAMGVESNPKHSGMIIGFINMIAIIPSIIVSPLFGEILDVNWSGKMANGAKVFSVNAYQHGMVLEYSLIGLAVIIALFLFKD